MQVWRRNEATSRQSWALAFVLPLIYSPHVHLQSMVLLLAAAVLYAAAQDPRHSVLRAEHLLLGLVLFVVFWLVSVAGVSLLFLSTAVAFVTVLRSWPATNSAASTPSSSDTEPYALQADARAA